MADDREEIVGVWKVWFQKWVWEYKFDRNGTVSWRDPLNNEQGTGRWLKTGNNINLTWKDSTSVESWSCPIRPVGQGGWYKASYGTGPFKAEKVVQQSSPEEALHDSPPPFTDDSITYMKPPQNVPASSKPVFDDQSGGVVGFAYTDGAGYWAFYDLTGKFLESAETPLETPILDPIDFVMFGAGIARGVGRAIIRAGMRAAASAGTKAVIRSLTTQVIAKMRPAYQHALSVGALKFTETVVKRLAVSGRQVPLSMIKMCIRYGKRAPDRDGVKGVYQYTLEMIKSEKNIAPGLEPARSWAGKTYTLKVVIKDELRGSTVFHVHYE